MRLLKQSQMFLLVSAGILLGMTTTMSSEEKTYGLIDNDKIDIISEEQTSVEFELEHTSNFNPELLKSIALITKDGKTNKLSLSTDNYISGENETLTILVPISDLNLDDEIEVVLNTEYRGEKLSTSKRLLVKEENFVPSVISYIENNINIYKNISPTFSWTVTNLSAEQLKGLDIEVYLGDYRLSTSVKENSIIVSLPISKLSTKDIDLINNEGINFSLKLFIRNNNANIVELQETIHIYNEQELLNFNFNKHYIELAKGTANTISIKKTPSDFDCKLSYSSSNPSVVEINDKGIIHAVDVGSATITSSCGNKKTKAVVKVHNDPVSVKFGKGIKFVEVGKTKSIDLIVTPSTAIIDYSKLSLASSDFIIASIDKNSGVITAYNEGEVEISYTFNYEEYKETYQIIPAVEEIKTSLDDWFRMQVGDVINFTVETLPFDISEYTNIDISSSNENILSITSHSITAIGTGVARLFFTYDNIQSYVDIEIIESNDKLSDFALSSPQATISVGQAFSLRNVFISKGIAYEELTFSCEEDELVNISDDGVITANKKGVVLIKLVSKSTTQYFKLKIK